MYQQSMAGGSYWFCRAGAHEVLQFLLAGASLPFKVTGSSSSPSTVMFESKGSFRHPGETVVIKVTELGGGCIVMFHVLDGHPVDPTANPNGLAGRIALAVSGRFGEMTPSG